MSDITDRLALPFIIAGQGQKEVTHNEALLRLDFLVQPVVLEVAPVAIPAAPAVGQCWIVGSASVGVWVGKANQIACWTGSGWRFAVPVVGMRCWSIADAVHVQFEAGGWVKGHLSASILKIGNAQVVGPRQAAINTPAGGTNADAEARLALSQILVALRTHGLIST